MMMTKRLIQIVTEEGVEGAIERTDSGYQVFHPPALGGLKVFEASMQPDGWTFRLKIRGPYGLPDIAAVTTSCAIHGTYRN